MNKIVIYNLPVPRQEDDVFSTEQFLHDIYNSLPDKLSNKQFKVLDRLCKKIDVVRKIFICYKIDLSKAESNILIELKYSIVLISILLYYAKTMDDFKFLNSAMKLFDLTQNHISPDIQALIRKSYADLLYKLDISL